MTSLQKFLSYFCLIFIVICSIFVPLADAADTGPSAASYNSCDGTFACAPPVRALLPALPCTQFQGQQEAPQFNEHIARIRRSAHYQHPKSNGPLLFHTGKVWLYTGGRPRAARISLPAYNPYYSRANTDYYSFLFRLTPF